MTSIICEIAIAETPMVIIALLASLNSCVNPWIYLSFNDHVTLSWLCRRRARAKSRFSGSSDNTGTTRTSRPASGVPLTGDMALYRLSRLPRSTTANARRRCASVDL